MASPRFRFAPSESRWKGQTHVRLPARSSSAAWELTKRMLIVVGLLMAVTLIVYLDRDAYADHASGAEITFIDSLYYATVTMTTTGYGDITPVAQHARLLNTLLVTPIRIAFLVLLVGTTVEVLANEGRRALMDSQWRKNLRNHTVLIGYGTMGQSAANTLLRAGIDAERIVVIDHNPQAVAAANRHGYAALEGDATSRELLRRAELPRAREVIITVNRDDTTILSTLTIRQLNRGAHVVAAVRDAENVALVRQSGADAVVTSSDAVGRLMGLSSISPHLGVVIEDLLSSGEGLEVAQRMVRPEEDGRPASEVVGEKVLAVIHNKTLRRFFDASAEILHTGDEVVVVRRSVNAKPRPE